MGGWRWCCNNDFFFFFFIYRLEGRASLHYEVGFGGYPGRGRQPLWQQNVSDDSDSSDGSNEKDSEQDEEEAKRSLQEEIERKYFPDRFPWTPFGDPFEGKRR